MADALEGGLAAVVSAQRRWFEAHGWDVEVLDPVAPSRFLDVRALWRAGRRLRAHADGRVLHCHGMRTAAAALSARVRPFVTVHGAGALRSDPLGNHLLRRLGLLALPRLTADAFTAAPELRGWRFLPHASPRLASLDRLPFPSGSTPVLAWIGRLGEPKRPSEFVAAVRRADAIGVVAADGELPGMDNRGWLDDPAPVLAEAWAVVLYSDYEAVPFALQEAMWCGRPVVASPLPGVRWLAGDDVATTVTPYLSCTAAAEAGERAARRVRTLLSPDDPWAAIAAAYA